MDRQSQKDERFQRLKHSLQALAADASEQNKLFPKFTVKPDELVIDFDNWHSAAFAECEHDMTIQQVEALSAIDRLFESAKPDSGAWAEGALETHPFWKDIRVLARKALMAFGWPLELPPSYAQEYVRSKPN